MDIVVSNLYQAVKKPFSSFLQAFSIAGVDKSCATQLIYGDGTLNAPGVEHFMEQVKLGESGYEYAVVSIMGPQSSGKSTLLNHLFGTKFQQMNAELGRHVPSI